MQNSSIFEQETQLESLEDQAELLSLENELQNIFGSSRYLSEDIDES